MAKTAESLVVPLASLSPSVRPGASQALLLVTPPIGLDSDTPRPSITEVGTIHCPTSYFVPDNEWPPSAHALITQVTRADSIRRSTRMASPRSCPSTSSPPAHEIPRHDTHLRRSLFNKADFLEWAAAYICPCQSSLVAPFVDSWNPVEVASNYFLRHH